MPNTPIATHQTSVEQVVTVTHPVTLFVRESKKNPDTIVVGAAFNGVRKRVVLVRVNADETITVRTLDGNPREASSRAETQTKLVLPVSDLTDDA